jgi:hypothetical protein
MVRAKSRNDHRNDGRGLVEIVFKPPLALYFRFDIGRYSRKGAPV